MIKFFLMYHALVNPCINKDFPWYDSSSHPQSMPKFCASSNTVWMQLLLFEKLIYEDFFGILDIKCYYPKLQTVFCQLFNDASVFCSVPGQPQKDFGQNKKARMIRRSKYISLIQRTTAGAVKTETSEKKTCFKYFFLLRKQFIQYYCIHIGIR